MEQGGPCLLEDLGVQTSLILEVECVLFCVVLELWRALAENPHSQHFSGQNPRGYALGI